jgi:hypothetical protein
MLVFKYSETITNIKGSIDTNRQHLLTTHSEPVIFRYRSDCPGSVILPKVISSLTETLSSHSLGSIFAIYLNDICQNLVTSEGGASLPIVVPTRPDAHLYTYLNQTIPLTVAVACSIHCFVRISQTFWFSLDLIQMH